MLSVCKIESNILEEPEGTGFFNPTPSQKKLLSKEAFFALTRWSPAVVPYGDDSKYHKIPLKDLIIILGKPLEEKPYLDISGSGVGVTHPKMKCFVWALKDDKYISYDVRLSDDCPDEVATLENILEYGIVYNLYKVPLTVTVLPDGYFDSVPGDTGE
jgi:hypothetical protein